MSKKKVCDEQGGDETMMDTGAAVEQEEPKQEESSEEEHDLAAPATEDDPLDPLDPPVVEEEQWSTIEVLPSDTKHLCRTEACEATAVVIWKSNQPEHEHDVWPLCEPCQAADFGGWEDGVERLTAVAAAGSSKNVAEATDKSGEEVAMDEEPEETWECKKVQSIAALNHESPIVCMTEGCNLIAASAWVSNLEPKNWYNCLDCQEADFEGWPSLSELPVTHMTEEHMELLRAKCSKFSKNTAMPVFPQSPTKETTTEPFSNTVITPLPGHHLSTATATTQKKAATAKGKSNSITPNLSGSSVVAKQPKKAAQPDKARLDFHRKWQAAAEASGGPSARIVLDRALAKPIIFDYLYDAFSPMNITQIHTGLKAVVPSPVLKACLDDMALDYHDGSDQFADSDDDDDEDALKKTKTNQVTADAVPYKGSLSFKAGKGASSSLYYVNYATAKNGDGLGATERNTLASDSAIAQAEAEALNQSIVAMTAQAKQLNSEPTNDQAVARLEKEESELAELLEQLEDARKLKVNEKHKQQTKRRIDNLTTVWRKRRRICKEFLGSLEELTDGTVSRKTCLAGNGQIEVDSDEAVAKFAVVYGKKKRANKAKGGKKLKFVGKSKKKEPVGIPPSEDFVAVVMNAKGLVDRVHLDDDATP